MRSRSGARAADGLGGYLEGGMRGRLAAAIALVTASCGYPDFGFEAPNDDATIDSTIADEGSDAIVDSKIDANADADAVADATNDTGVTDGTKPDTAPETIADSGVDSGTLVDSGVDTGVDSGSVKDTGVVDTGTDATGTDATDPCALVDDLEDGNGQVILTCGRNGYWFSFNDGSSTGVQTPDPSITFLPSAGGPGTSLFAAYTAGSGFTSWGAGIGFNFVDKGLSYDASTYGGIAFWAKVDGGTTATTIRFDFPDIDTDPRGSICTTKTAGCFDHWGIVLTLDTTWTWTTIRFADLAQEGFGYTVPSFDPAHLYTMQLQTGASKIFGVWLDDITLVP